MADAISESMRTQMPISEALRTTAAARGRELATAPRPDGGFTVRARIPAGSPR